MTEFGQLDTGIPVSREDLHDSVSTTASEDGRSWDAIFRKFQKNVVLGF